ncbi:MAG: hypothetical protein U9R00_02055 [Patescibacteria group bacterium]|nr:hypothetical protein [Patescibacteria group bacterium]
MEKFNEVVFLCGNGNSSLGIRILKELSKLLGKNCVFDHINFSNYPERELDNNIVDYKKLKGKTVVFFQSMFSEQNILSEQYFDEIIDLIWAAKHQYGANRILGIFPFIKDRRQDPSMQEIILADGSKKVAKPYEIQRLKKNFFFLKVAGLDGVLTATPHSNAMAEYCKEYKIKFHEIELSPVFVKNVHTFVKKEELNLVVAYAPDAGSIPRAIAFARIMNCPVYFNLKNRDENGNIKILDKLDQKAKTLEKKLRSYYEFKDIHFATSDLVKGKIIVMIEDEVSSGDTANKTARNLKKFSVKSILFFATHSVLNSGWKKKFFKNEPFEVVGMADTIIRDYKNSTGGKILSIQTAPLFASSLFHLLKDG